MDAVGESELGAVSLDAVQLLGEGDGALGAGEALVRLVGRGDGDIRGDVDLEADEAADSAVRDRAVVEVELRIFALRRIAAISGETSRTVGIEPPTPFARSFSRAAITSSRMESTVTAASVTVFVAVTPE